MKNAYRLSTVVLIFFISASQGVQKIDNELAPPEVIIQGDLSSNPAAPQCDISGPELDLLFVLDSSDSLSEQFIQEIGAIKRVLDYVVISPETTRVALIQFTGNARTEFHFDTFTNRGDIFKALDILRPMSGITKIGNAFAHARTVLSETNGMRGPWVPKVLFLLSDGRSHDYPADWMNAEILRQEIPYLDIWAYGTGQHIALNAIKNYTLDSSKIAREASLDVDIPRIFAGYEGVEVCTTPPPCLPGSDKPMDLLFIFDSSTSLGAQKFMDQIKFMKRLLHHIWINKKAVKVAMITYKGSAKLEFSFDTFLNKTKLLMYLDTLKPTKGTTDTRKAINQAIDMFTDPERGAIYGVRSEEIPKVVIMLTDGFSSTRHSVESSVLLQVPNITVYAVAVSPRNEINMESLLMMTGQKKDRVFNGLDLHKFEESFVMDHVGFGCNGVQGPYIESIRGAVDTECDQYGVRITVRTRKEFFGKLYVKDYYIDPACVSNGNTDFQISLDVDRDRCGLRGIPTFNEATGEAGLQYNFTAVVQFHQTVVTRVDQGLDISCFHPDPTIRPQAGIPDQPKEIQCDYSIRNYNNEGCLALDATIGDTLHHRWECAIDHKVYPYGLLVHDCVAESDDLSIPIIDSEGCEVDGYMLETPKYKKIQYARRSAPVILPFASQEMYTFKFPQATSIQFRCLISLCDLDQFGSCKREISAVANGKCGKKDGRYTNEIRRSKRQIVEVPTRRGYISTREVVTRRINVLESPAMNPGKTDAAKYCTTY